MDTEELNSQSWSFDDEFEALLEPELEVDEDPLGVILAYGGHRCW